MSAIGRLTAAGGIMLCLVAGADGGEWPQWRGPTLNGVADAAGLPERFSPTEGVLWSTALPGPSAATPAIVGERVFLTAVDGRQNRLLAMGLDRATGRVLWQYDAGPAVAASRNTMASPSPAADEATAYFLFGTGRLLALDHDGKLLWSRELERELGQFEIQFGYGASPLLFKGRLFVSLIQNDRRDRWGRRVVSENRPPQSCLLAIDPRTGEDVWRTVRPHSDAGDESGESYATPLGFEGAGRAEVVLIGGDAVTGHDWQSGRELWRWAGYNPRKRRNYRVVPTPLAMGGTLLVCAPQGGPVFALRGGAEGVAGDEQVLWRAEDLTADVCTPLYYNGLLYLLDGDQFVMTCLDPATGEKKWQGTILDRRATAAEGGDVIRASPTAADGRIYCLSEKGRLVILAAEKGQTEMRVLHSGSMRTSRRDEPCQATIAVAGGQLFVRTAQTLYCIAWPASGEVP
jgi:outer membrane protein assembly factor BamB